MSSSIPYRGSDGLLCLCPRGYADKVPVAEAASCREEAVQHASSSARRSGPALKRQQIVAKPTGLLHQAKFQLGLFGHHRFVPGRIEDEIDLDAVYTRDLAHRLLHPAQYFA